MWQVLARFIRLLFLLVAARADQLKNHFLRTPVLGGCIRNVILQLERRSVARLARLLLELEHLRRTVISVITRLLHVAYGLELVLLLFYLSDSVLRRV